MSDKVLSKDVLVKSNSSEYNNCAQVQELNDVKEFLKIQHNKYIKCKILYDAVQECVENSNILDDDLKVKVQDILLNNSCAQVTPIESESFTQDCAKLLGISHQDRTELNHSESLKFKKSIEVILQEKYKNICKQFSKTANENINETLPVSSDFLDFNLNTEDYKIIEFKQKLNDQQKQYLQNLLKEQEILDDITKLRLEHLPKICNEKVKECQIKSYMNMLRTKIVEEKTRVDIFMETSNSLPAYEEILKDIKKQQEECHNDIEYLQKLKERYNQITCKQFNDLLKSYVQYKTSLEKKKIIYESLKN
ncbi:hypothetical protein BDFB_008022 [Asbolus verrucosus]|uniref:Uncharacterized protein n=1 Tax=Asbolus verrucosus TaxID=1661398 RepID=A0A482VAR5_ASBVE|nr:hypothetical protein BDFB_008022 [Asbolus verrucosus]